MSLLSPNLLAFQAIIKRSTVIGAADEIGLTQTGVTQRIRALERELGVALFTRSRKGMLLTKEGEALYRYCQASNDLAGIALSQIEGAAIESEVTVGITGPTSLMSSRIVPSCITLREQFPNLLFHFDILDLPNRIESLRSGKVQMAIVPHEQVAHEMDSKVLEAERFVLVGSPKWRGRRVKDIIVNERIIDFDPTDTTSFSYLESFELLGLVNNSRHFVNENNALIKMFSTGIGYGTLSSEIAAPLIERGELIVLNSGKFYEQKHALAWYPRNEMPKYFKEIISIMK